MAAKACNTDGMVMRSGDLKPNKELASGLGYLVLVQEGIEGWKDGKRRLEVACFITIDR